MAYIDTNTRTTKPTSGDKSVPLGRVNQLFGVYMGFVKRVGDVQDMGRLQLWIPELGSAPEDEGGWVTASYCSPFAGATNVDANSKGDLKSFDGTQTSYGMWFVPPDINNQVLVMFVNGDPSKAFWIGCVYNQFVNNMVPGVPASGNNYQYPNKNVPVAEYNKWNKSVTNPDQATRPVNETKFKGIGNQGLITDPVRGVTTSGARRESPSEVFGILTPGPLIDSELPYSKVRRKGGHALIMDDKNDSEYIQLTTKSGAQIRINETNGFVYINNRDGTAWIQMDYEGNIDIFGARDISMRAQRDFNIRADRNVNIEAGQNIFMKAAKDTQEGTTAFTYNVNNDPDLRAIPVWRYVGPGKGEGGDIVMQAMNDWQSTTKNAAYLTVEQDDMNIVVQGGAYNLTTVAGGQNIKSKMGIKLATEASFDLQANSDIRAASNGSVDITGTSGITLCTPAQLSLNADGGIAQNSAGSISITSSATVAVIGATGLGLASGSGGAGIQGGLSVSGQFTANSGSTLRGQVDLGGATVPPGPPPSVNTPNSPQAPQSPGSAVKAQVKPLNEKVNILATWKDQDSKFKRDSQPVQVTVSRFPTYEPCPEHEQWSISSVSGYAPIITPDDATYRGSGTSGNEQTTTPEASVNPGSNNTSVQGDSANSSSVSKDVPQGALKCQLIRHEGRKNVSYKDSLGLLTGGIGHLLRQNEVSNFPEGSPISDEQIEKWYNEDVVSATKIAQKLSGDVWGDLSEIRKRAIIDLAYNLGEQRLSKFVNFWAAFKKKDFQTAGQELQNSKWYGQVKSRGPAIVSMVVSNIDPTGCSGK